VSLPERAGPNQIDYLVFEIAGRLCAVDAGHVQEIVFLPELARSPGQPSVLEGFLNLRGRAAPVIRLDRLFDFPRFEPDLFTPLIILKTGGGPFAVMAAHVREIAHVQAGELRLLSDHDSFNGCAEAQFAASGGDVTVLAPGRILLEKEARCVSELQAKTQAILDGLRDAQA
jgi:purine-binding chemotaxis protein CheW